MKILLVGPQWIGGWVEGVERAVYELGHRFQTFYYDTPVAPNIVRNKITVSSYLPSVFNPLTIPVAESVGSFWEKQMNQKLINRARTFKPDLILILKGETLQAETLVAIQA
ncbi:MAG: hypothetical protein U0Z26_12465, partial [Anaerolineales bacterium]